MEIKFTKEDFNRLKKIEGINNNKKYFLRNKGYSSPSRKEEVKNLQKPVWTKMKQLKIALLEETYFNTRFDISESNPHKQSNKPLGSLTRQLIWISLVDQIEYSRMDKAARDRARLPQLQISLQPKRLVVASVWLEANHCDQVYREKFLDYLEDHKLDNKYKIEIYDKNKEQQVPLSELSKVRDKKNYGIGIIRKLDANEVIKLGEDIYSIIVKEIQILNENFFSSCFNYKVERKSKKIFRSEKSRRKSRAKFDIMESMRKGTKAKKVTYKHRKIQNYLFDYFNNKYNASGIATELENDFVDIKLEFRGTNSVILYEIKTDNSAIKCLKNGLGQLLFYGYVNREKGWKKIDLVIVGLHKMTKEAKKFVNSIKVLIGKNKFRYQVFDEKKKILLPELKS